MTPAVAGLLLFAALSAIVDWAAVWRGGPMGRAMERIAKPVVMLALIAGAMVWPVDPGSEAAAVRPWLVAGLVASLAGDLLLLPPGRFVPGLVAFLLGHVAYLVAFAQLPGSVPWMVAGLVAAGVLIATVGRVLVRAARRTGLGGPVALYLVAICAMAVAATRTGEPAAILGAWLFVASDAMLGWGRLRAPTPGMPRGGGRGLGLAVMVTYHLAQGLLVLALVA
ncbi:MAG TPA: lysoplasmalogenase [Candidatus Limnocylindrales bacterium]|nr:lysoplasmalogenase [Candidatus Limnocylindrales bacterium]